MTDAASSPSPRRPGLFWTRVGSAVIVLAGLVVSALVATVFHQREVDRARTVELRDALALQNVLQGEVDRLEQQVRSIQGVMATSRGYDPMLLARFDSVTAAPGPVPWRAFAVAPVLAAEDRASVLEVVRDDQERYRELGYPEYRIFPDTGASVIAPVVLVQPASSREGVFGFEMLSHPDRRATALRAIRSGGLELSPAVALTQDSSPEARSLLLMAAFRRASSSAAGGTSSAGAALADTLGLVAVSFTPSELIRRAVGELGFARAALDVELQDPRSGLPVLRFGTRVPGGDVQPSSVPADPLEVSLRGESHRWVLRGHLGAAVVPWRGMVAPVVACLVITLLALLLFVRERRARERLAVSLERQASELRRTQAQVARSQRVEALGRLTGGIAHDFNNLLGVVLGNLDLMGHLGEDEAEERDELRQHAVSASRRAALLTHRLLTFGRKAPLVPRTLRVEKLLTELHPLLRTSVPENIDLEVSLPETPLWVQADRVQLESAVLNLVVNARDACGPGDTIRVRAERLDPGALPGEAHGATVCLAVEDTGSGMRPEVVERATDPFFTTKEVGKGSGLGLSSTVGFLRHSGGDLSIESAPGEGTTVRMLLPAVEPPDGEGLASEGGEVARAARSERRSRCRILVVEDGPEERRALRRDLEREGFEVLDVADGGAAMERLAGPESPRAVVSAARLPGNVQGGDLAWRGRELAIPVVLVSDPASGDGEDEACEWAAAHLSGPLRMEDLLPVLDHLCPPARRRPMAP